LSECAAHLTQIAISFALIGPRVHEERFWILIGYHALNQDQVIASTAEAVNQNEQLLAPLVTRALNRLRVDTLGKVFIRSDLLAAQHTRSRVLLYKDLFEY